jgi:hypothetical protein
MKQRSNTHIEDTTPQRQLEQAGAGKRIVSAKVSIFILGGILLVAAATRLVSADKSPNHYVAHEWGTFTSVQGSDGVLLEWQPLETSHLPKFVYNWINPGAGRPLELTKATTLSLQRMETPVIYFYSGSEQTVDVSVRFPKGVITEWYPQATEILRGTLPVMAVQAKTDQDGPATGSTPPLVVTNQARKESYAKWKRLAILPQKKNLEIKQSLPQDSSGSHYFAARMADSDYLSSSAAANCSSEHEKFIFYRGVGNFDTPLRVTMTSENSATVANTGRETLQHLFVLQLRDGTGNFHYVDRLGPGEQQTVVLSSSSQMSIAEKLSHQLGERMAESLIKEGLYQREATAMVNTWKDSWFQEEGVRVLYVLPREWTDRILPLTLEPSPRELTRVMVGRAEVITPEMQNTFAESLRKAIAGDLEARQRTIVQMAKLGRFAEPAVRLVTKDATMQEKQNAWKLLYERPQNLKNQLSLIK